MLEISSFDVFQGESPSILKSYARFYVDKMSVAYDPLLRGTNTHGWTTTSINSSLGIRTKKTWVPGAGLSNPSLVPVLATPYTGTSIDLSGPGGLVARGGP